MVFYFVLMSMKYLIYFWMLPKKHLSGSEMRKKKKQNKDPIKTQQ